MLPLRQALFEERPLELSLILPAVLCGSSYYNLPATNEAALTGSASPLPAITQQSRGVDQRWWLSVAPWEKCPICPPQGLLNKCGLFLAAVCHRLLCPLWTASPFPARFWAPAVLPPCPPTFGVGRHSLHRVSLVASPCIWAALLAVWFLPKHVQTSLCLQVTGSASGCFTSVTSQTPEVGNVSCRSPAVNVPGLLGDPSPRPLHLLLRPLRPCLSLCLLLHCGVFTVSRPTLVWCADRPCGCRC